MNYIDLEQELRQATESIIKSDHPKKLIVAGPGTGKTYLFKGLLEKANKNSGSRLVITFINNLKDDLDKKLSHLSHVFTFHGYCYHLLRKSPGFRAGLSDQFYYFPKLAHLVKRDWELIKGGETPHFVKLMRDLQDGDETRFYWLRSNYYDAVEFDDSVYRVYHQLLAGRDKLESYTPLIVDEYQDFNRLEAEFIKLFASTSAIVIAGDDDQALYAKIRGAKFDFIRQLQQSGEYEFWTLPFCLRCPQPIVGAVENIVNHASKNGWLQGRITKPYRFYPPLKAVDSKKYPFVNVVTVSAQSERVNYFGRYIAQQVRKIPKDEIEESKSEEFPTVLVIGSRQYLRQIRHFLEESGFIIEMEDKAETARIEREEGISIIKQNIKSNLGWRIMIEAERPTWADEVVIKSGVSNTSLYSIIPADYREDIVSEVEKWEKVDTPEHPVQLSPSSQPTIKLTSFEGSKGLSAQHVFIVGLHANEFPKDARNIEDLEICRFIVALTRARKQCYLMHTGVFSGTYKQPSVFLSWIGDEWKKELSVNKKYWQ